MTTCARRWTRRSMGTNLGTPRFWLNLKKWGESPQPTRTKGIKWSHPPGSNRRPTDYESVALPAELGWPSGQILKWSTPFGTLFCDHNTERAPQHRYETIARPPYWFPGVGSPRS